MVPWSRRGAVTLSYAPDARLFHATPSALCRRHSLSRRRVRPPAQDWQDGPLKNDGLGGTTWAWCQNVTGDKCNNGQTAYWYSQGCFIGCPDCDHVSGRRQTDLCKKGFVGQLPDDAIAVNRDVERNSPQDIYRHNPWRAPGFAPVADACGLAGGTPWGAVAPEEGQYINTTHARHGMKGTELPRMDTGTVWKGKTEQEKNHWPVASPLFDRDDANPRLLSSVVSYRSRRRGRGCLAGQLQPRRRLLVPAVPGGGQVDGSLLPGAPKEATGVSSRSRSSTGFAETS